MAKNRNVAQKVEDEQQKKKKRRGIIAALLGLGAATCTGIGTTVYYAIRPSAQTYTVTIKNVTDATIYGGTKQTVLAGTLIGQLPTPYKSDKVFVNWQDSTGRSLLNDTHINSNIEVYAVWGEPEMDAHTVTIDLNGGTLPGLPGNTIRVNNRTLVGKLPSPVKNGFVFDKWQKNGEDLPFNTPITSSITIKAIYKETSSSSYIDGGKRLLEFKSDAKGSDTGNKWKLIKSGTELSGVTWSITDTSGNPISGLSITDGVVEWDKVAVGSYVAKITGSADGTSASAEIGVVVTDPVYTLSGGTTRFDVKSTETKEDTGKVWTLKKESGGDVGTYKLSIENISPAIGSGTITITNGIVKLVNISAGLHTFDVVAKNASEKLLAVASVSVNSTETYTIQYGDGKSGTSLTVKDIDKDNSSAFTLLKNGATSSETVEWSLTYDVEPKSGSIAFDTATGKENTIKYTTVAPGTYNLTITAKVGKETKATIPFTLTSKDTKIEVVIKGSNTINMGVDGLQSRYTTNVSDTDRITWAVDKWTGQQTAIPTIDSKTGVVTVKNVEDPEGTLTIAATDSLSGQTAKLDIKVNLPVVATNDIWIFDATNLWCRVTGLAGTGDITKTKLDGTAVTPTIARASFNEPIYIGQKVTSIGDDFLSDCTTFNSAITFGTVGTDSECMVIGNGFMSGCSVFNKKLTLPSKLQIIGDDFLEECVAFNNTDTTSPTTTFDLPSTLTFIGNEFMYDCKAISKNISIPTSVTHVGNDFMYDCIAMGGNTITIPDAKVFSVSTALSRTLGTTDAITNAVKISGDSTDFMGIFPNYDDASTSGFFRKLAAA